MRLARPMPPTPTPAMFSVSLGGTKPRPSTYLGTMLKAAAVVAVLVRNERREIVFVGVIRVSMATPPIIARQEIFGQFSASSGGHTSTRLLQGLPERWRRILRGNIDDHTRLIPGVDRSADELSVVDVEEFLFGLAFGHRIRQQSHHRAEVFGPALHVVRILQTPEGRGNAVRSVFRGIVIIGDLVLARLPPVTQFVHENPPMHAFFEKLLGGLAALHHLGEPHESRLLIGWQSLPGRSVQ